MNIEKKAVTFAIIEIICKRTNKENRLKPKEIKEILKNEYNYIVNDKTIRNTLKLLRENGYKISEYENNNLGYYVTEGKYSKEEYNALIFSIIDSEDIELKTKIKIINKIKEDQGMYANLENHNIEIILESMNKDKKISFEYNNKKYIFNPYDIQKVEDKYYLIGAEETNSDYYNSFWVDKMKNVSRTSIKLNKNKALQTIEKYKKNSAYFSTNEHEKIEMVFKNEMLAKIKRLFKYGYIEKTLETEFPEYKYKITIEKNIEDAITFAVRYIDYVKIIAPTIVIDKLKIKVKKINNMYK